MKLLVIPNKYEEISPLLNMDVEGIIIGIEKLSVYFKFSLKLKEIKKIDRKNKKIFISMNKIMHNSDIEFVKSIIDEIKELDVSGIFVSDIGSFNILRENNLPVIIDQVHLINNYKTCDYYLSKGALAVCLSNELTLKDINEIISKTDVKLVMQVFGYIPMFNSYRKLLSNYFEYISGDKKDDNYYIYDENRKSKYYVDEQDETALYSNNIMNSIDEKIDIEYGIINGFNIESDLLYRVINDFNNGVTYLDMSDYIQNMDTGFLYKECIYKVREHE